MKHLHIPCVLLTLLFALAAGTGCDKTNVPPAPLTAEEMPTAFEKAFAKAKPEAKELANQVVAAVQAKDYPKAFQAVQALGGMPSLTKQQISVASSAMITVNTLLQEAQAQGDAKATQAIQYHRATK